MATRYLSRYYDPALKLPSIESREELETGEVERLKRALAIVVIAGSIPRRLGGDATDEDLALEKKRARRVSHALSQALKGWTKRAQKLPDDDEIRREGAQLNWEKWTEAHLVDLQNRMRLCATYAIQAEDEPWGTRAIVRLNNEHSWITYALRD